MVTLPGALAAVALLLPAASHAGPATATFGDPLTGPAIQCTLVSSVWVANCSNYQAPFAGCLTAYRVKYQPSGTCVNACPVRLQLWMYGGGNSYSCIYDDLTPRVLATGINTFTLNPPPFVPQGAILALFGCDELAIFTDTLCSGGTINGTTAMTCDMPVGCPPAGVPCSVTWSNRRLMMNADIVGATCSPTATMTAIALLSSTASATTTAAATGTPTPSASGTGTGTATASGTATRSGTATVSGTSTESGAATPSPTPGGIVSETATASRTPAVTETPTASRTRTVTGTSHASGTATASATEAPVRVHPNPARASDPVYFVGVPPAGRVEIYNTAGERAAAALLPDVSGTAVWRGIPSRRTRGVYLFLVRGPTARKTRGVVAIRE